MENGIGKPADRNATQFLKEIEARRRQEIEKQAEACERYHVQLAGVMSWSVGVQNAEKIAVGIFPGKRLAKESAQELIAKLRACGIKAAPMGYTEYDTLSLVGGERFCVSGTESDSSILNLIQLQAYVLTKYMKWPSFEEWPLACFPIEAQIHPEFREAAHANNERLVRHPLRFFNTYCHSPDGVPLDFSGEEDDCISDDDKIYVLDSEKLLRVLFEITRPPFQTETLKQDSAPEILIGDPASLQAAQAICNLIFSREKVLKQREPIDLGQLDDTQPFSSGTLITSTILPSETGNDIGLKLNPSLRKKNGRPLCVL